jgi:hypothetical protein
MRLLYGILTAKTIATYRARTIDSGDEIRILLGLSLR